MVGGFFLKIQTTLCSVIGGSMVVARLFWKIFFIVQISLLLFSLYDAYSLPDIIAPSHPNWLGFLVFFSDFMMTFGTLCYAFKLKVLPRAAIWMALVFLFFMSNSIILFFDFYNNLIGYEVNEIVNKLFFSVVIYCVLALPTYLYCRWDLTFLKNNKTDSAF